MISLITTSTTDPWTLNRLRHMTLEMRSRSWLRTGTNMRRVRGREFLDRLFGP